MLNNYKQFSFYAMLFLIFTAQAMEKEHSLMHSAWLGRFFPFESQMVSSEQEQLSSVFVVRDPLVSNAEQIKTIHKAVDQAVQKQARIYASEHLEKNPNKNNSYRISLYTEQLNAQDYATSKLQCINGTDQGSLTASLLNQQFAENNSPLRVRYEGQTTATRKLQHVYVISTKFPELQENLVAQQNISHLTNIQPKSSTSETQASTGHFYGQIRLHDSSKPTRAQILDGTEARLQLDLYPYGPHSSVDVRNPENFPWITGQVEKCSTLHEFEQLHPALKTSYPGRNHFIQLLDAESFIAQCKKDQSLQDYPAAHDRIAHIMTSENKELILKLSRILNSYHYIENFKHIYDATPDKNKTHVVDYTASRIAALSKHIERTPIEFAEARKHVNTIANLLTEYPELAGKVLQLEGDVAAVYRAQARVMYDSIKDVHTKYNTKAIIHLTTAEETYLLGLNNAVNNVAYQNGYFQHLINACPIKAFDGFQAKVAELLHNRSRADYYRVTYQQFKSIINTYGLVPAVFTKNYTQIEQQDAQKDLFNAVRGLNLAPHELTFDAQLLVKDFAHLTASLIDDNKLQEAQSILNCINKATILDFLKGVGKELKDEALNMLFAAPVALAMSTAGKILLPPHVIALCHLTGAAYGIYNNAAALKADFELIIKAVKEGSAYEVGQAAAKLAGSTFAAATTGRFIYKGLTKAKTKGFLQQAVGIVEQSIDKAKEFELIRQESQVLLETVKSLPMYKELAQEAVQVGSSIQAFERRLVYACTSVGTAEDVCFLIKEIHKCFSLQHKYSAKGINRLLKLDFDHLANLVIKQKGNYVCDISGFHSDYLGKIQASDKLKFRDIQETSEGIYKAYIKYGNKEKISSFFPKNWNLHKVAQEVLEATSKVDFDQVPLGKDGKKRYTGLCNGGIEFTGYVNPITGEILSPFPIHKSWTKETKG